MIVHYGQTLINAKLYRALSLWSDVEKQLGDNEKALYYADYAAKLKKSFNKTIEEGLDYQFPFPHYENGDLFLSWGGVGVESYAKVNPDLALKYVENVLKQYDKDGLAFQRYARINQEGAGGKAWIFCDEVIGPPHTRFFSAYDKQGEFGSIGKATFKIKEIVENK